MKKFDIFLVLVFICLLAMLWYANEHGVPRTLKDWLRMLLFAESVESVATKVIG